MSHFISIVLIILNIFDKINSQIKDADNERYEVPDSILNLAIPRRLNKNFYRVEYISDRNQPFAFKIIRASNNVTL